MKKKISTLFFKIHKVFKILASSQKKWVLLREKPLVVADGAFSTWGSKAFGDGGDGSDGGICVQRGDELERACKVFPQGHVKPRLACTKGTPKARVLQ